MIRNQPSKVAQDELENFLDMISPSIKLKILMFQYKQILSGVNYIKDNNDLIESLIHKIELFTMEPEQQLIEQYDLYNKNIVFTGAGTVLVYQNFDNLKSEFLGEIGTGKMINEHACVFNTCSSYELKSKTYATMGMID